MIKFAIVREAMMNDQSVVIKIGFPEARESSGYNVAWEIQTGDAMVSGIAAGEDGLQAMLEAVSVVHWEVSRMPGEVLWCTFPEAGLRGFKEPVL